ncbi:MAG: hypothetical protein K0S76_1116 [Herbinix sp.]|jgi:uncharacterized C2H2 Zn-finger protein|nr:hypothetical protein [Herbinix sp.]
MFYKLNDTVLFKINENYEKKILKVHAWIEDQIKDILKFWQKG